MGNLLLELENHTELTAHQCAKLLGCARVTYYQWRRENKVPPTVERMIQIILKLPMRMLNQLIAEYVYDNDL